MWDIKLKTTDEQQEKQTLIDTENSMVVTRRKGDSKG